jgi:hypothetical protein
MYIYIFTTVNSFIHFAFEKISSKLQNIFVPVKKFQGFVLLGIGQEKQKQKIQF